MNPEEWVVLARLDRSRGRIGELYATSFLGDARDFLGLEPVTLMGGKLVRPEIHHIQKARMHQGRLVLKFEGTDSISNAERLAGTEVCLRRRQLPQPRANEVYLADLVGCRMVDVTGARIGTIEGWESNGEYKFLLVAGGQGEFLVPFHRDLLCEIDIAERRVVARLPPGLEDLNAS
jgi:16S rRNA processing protein RimM